MKYISKSKTFELHVVKSVYSNFQTAIQLLEKRPNLHKSKDDPIYCVLSVNLYDSPKDEYHIFLDDNNLEKSLVDMLIKEGYIELTGRTAKSGFCEYREAKLLEKMLIDCIALY